MVLYAAREGRPGRAVCRLRGRAGTAAFGPSRWRRPGARLVALPAAEVASVAGLASQEITRYCIRSHPFEGSRFMNTTTRILLAAALVASMAACTKKTKPKQAPVSEPTTPPGRHRPRSTDDGRYDRCRPRPPIPACASASCTSIYDQDALKAGVRPQIMACHAKYLQDQPVVAHHPGRQRRRARHARVQPSASVSVAAMPFRQSALVRPTAVRPVAARRSSATAKSVRRATDCESSPAGRRTAASRSCTPRS